MPLLEPDHYCPIIVVDIHEQKLRLAHGLGATHTFEATLWGTITELREVIALAESGQLTPIRIERAPLEHI